MVRDCDRSKMDYVDYDDGSELPSQYLEIASLHQSLPSHAVHRTGCDPHEPSFTPGSSTASDPILALANFILTYN